MERLQRFNMNPFISLGPDTTMRITDSSPPPHPYTAARLRQFHEIFVGDKNDSRRSSRIRI